VLRFWLAVRHVLLVATAVTVMDASTSNIKISTYLTGGSGWSQDGYVLCCMVMGL
jgi:hypothetical protein